MNIKPSALIATIIVCTIGSLLILRELVWRFDPALDRTNRIQLYSPIGTTELLVVHQRSETKVDTVRRDFADIVNGVTYVTAWLDKGFDTIRFEIKGRYYSELRYVQLATDTSQQAFLVPNTEHGLPTSWGELVFIKRDGRLGHTLMMNPHIGDADKDGRWELYDGTTDAFYKLDPSTGTWVKTPIIPLPKKK